MRSRRLFIRQSAGAAALGLVTVAGIRNVDASTAQPDLSGLWTFTSDYKLDGGLAPLGAPPNSVVYQIRFANMGGGLFVGQYVNYPNPSRFELRVFTSARGSVITMMQFGEVSAYYASCAGRIVAFGGAAGVRGSWIDVDSNAGDFVLTRKG